MPSNEEQDAIYGNLQAYKLYTRPTAQRLFGKYSFRKKSGPKHHENVQKMLEILALNGPLTTWGMAKTHLDNSSSIRSKEKDYRRLLVGRMARGKHTLGLMDVGLVVKDGKNHLSCFRRPLRQNQPPGRSFMLVILTLISVIIIMP